VFVADKDVIINNTFLPLFAPLLSSPLVLISLTLILVCYAEVKNEMGEGYI